MIGLMRRGMLFCTFYLTPPRMWSSRDWRQEANGYGGLTARKGDATTTSGLTDMWDKTHGWKTMLHSSGSRMYYDRLFDSQRKGIEVLKEYPFVLVPYPGLYEAHTVSWDSAEPSQSARGF